MSFLTHSVSMPVWFLIMMNVIMVILLVKLFMLVYRYNRGDITKEEHSDMVVWKVKTTKRSAMPKTRDKPAETVKKEKETEKKTDMVQVLKILIKEGDRGVLMQTIADRMGTGRGKAQQAMGVLVEKKFVDEVVGVSGTKYYLTTLGREYCQSKTKT